MQKGIRSNVLISCRELVVTAANVQEQIHSRDKELLKKEGYCRFFISLNAFVFREVPRQIRNG